jgi:hypothetical protein
MKKTVLTILALIISLSIAVAKHKKHSKATTKEILSVTMNHGGCYGRCPVYNIKVENNGTVTYTGLRFVQDSGTFQKNVGADNVKTLFDKFGVYRVDTCSTIYRNRIPDLSGTYYTIVYKNKTQTIANTNFGPSYFKELTDDINKLGVVDNTWQKK